MFGLIWLAWMNGTLYYELHGREEGRTRLFVFAQMMLLTLLAVFTGGAAARTGVQFAIVYALYLVVRTWLWYTTRRQDAPEYMAATARYLVGMIVSVLVMIASAPSPPGWRMGLWAAFVVGWIVLMVVINRDSNTFTAFRVTDSMVERHGLFVIIVLGEVIVGVVDGLGEVDLTPRVIFTAMSGLS